MLMDRGMIEPCPVLLFVEKKMNLLMSDVLRARLVADTTATVILRADGASFEVCVDTCDGIFLLAAGGGDVLRFVDPREALLMLREAGVEQVRVDYACWTPEMRDAVGPDRAYDAWLHKKVQTSLAAMQDGSNHLYSQEEWAKIKKDRLARPVIS